MRKADPLLEEIVHEAFRPLREETDRFQHFLLMIAITYGIISSALFLLWWLS